MIDLAEQRCDGRILTWSFWERHRVRAPLGRPTMRSIAEHVADRWGVTVADLKGPTKSRKVAWPRQEFWSIARRWDFTTTQIGAFLNRDHTTALTGARAYDLRERQWAEAHAELQAAPQNYPITRIAADQGLCP